MIVALRDALAGMLMNPSGRTLIVDFGAGPGTGLLAVASEIQRLTGEPALLTYIISTNYR